MMMFVILKLLLLLLMVAASSELGILADDENDMGAPITTDPCLDSDYVYQPSKELPNGRFDFPDGFVLGTATSSYQRDVARMKFLNVDVYRFSISWPRIIPSGRRSDGVNQRGINFYHRLLDLLIENGIEPFVTIWHWDTPQGLEAEYGGFLSRDIVKDFEDYCDFLFQEFGSKVKKWITLNEPMGNSLKSYDEGVFAPGRCSVWVNEKCQHGDSAIEPYIVTHNLLLAHSAAYHLYKNKYQNLIGEVGITYVTHWFVPYSNSSADIAAAKRALDWMYGWYMDPITNGRYPYTMEMLLGSRLPKFTDDESRLLKSSYDFLGLNYYTGYFVKYNEDFDPVNLRYATDSHGITSPDRDGKYIGPHLGSYWQYLYPEGLLELLKYTKNKYNDPVIYITENGMSKKDNSSKTLAEALKDEGRINFYNLHLANVLRAMKEEQVKVKGFFTWSYADNFEWNEGYTVRFGLYYINYTDRSRHPKDTACWYTNFCKKTQPKSLKHFDFDHHKLINTTPATSLAAL